MSAVLAPSAEPAVDTPGLVSILIPVYQRAHLIEATVRSALAQIGPAIEVVVVDNASSDGTWEVLLRLARDDARLRIFRNEHNIGPVRNWRACIDQARGEFAKILWSDDLIEPGYLERCLPLLQDPSVGFVYSAARVFDDGSTGVTEQVVYRAIAEGIHPSDAYIAACFGDADVPVSPGCAVFRRADLARNLWVDVPNPVGSDFATHAIGNDLLIFLLTAADRPKFAVVGEPLSLFRAHAGSITSSTPPVRLVANYDLAKACFTASRSVKLELLQRLHLYLHIHLRRYGDMPYGLRAVGDFFPGQPRITVSQLALMRLDLRRFWSRVTRRLYR
jgi:glycosyltransferase involved in cell wall biosynthesis